MTFRTAARLSLAAVFSLVLLAAPPAQARFGKHSDSSSSKDDDDRDDGKHEATPAPPPQGNGSSSGSGGTHQAMPAGTPSYSGGDYSGEEHHHRHDGHRHPGRYHGGYAYGWGFGYSPYFFAPEPEPVPVPMEDANEAPAITATVGVTGQLHNQSGMSLGADAAVEGKRWGVRAAFTGIFAPTEGGQDGELDSIKLLDLHLSYAVLSGAHGRLRLELGATSAFAPDITFVAPDAGLSGAVGIVGPLGFEAAVSYTPWPYQRLDATAGLSLTLSAVGLKAGWRHLWLDDRGAVDGVRHTDTFTGPFIGVGLAF